ncbi:MAG TPA: hypothetical protein VFQ13_04205 [Anaerolineales bacterium]|nr:hypothetical protein [Anaerolineales bacterium]
MQRKNQIHIVSFVLVLILISLACATSQPTPTNTPRPTATETATPTKTLRPSPTSRPTKTPNFGLTEQAEEWNAELDEYVDLGYLEPTEGKFMKFDDFQQEWAQLGWYDSWLKNFQISDFYLSGHLKWSSAYRSADVSGCGFVFALDDKSYDQYAVFLDRSQVYFVVTEDGYYRPFKPTRGTGLVKFGNPADQPVEADFTLIVQDAYAHVLVDGKLVGEYSLSQSRMRGYFGLSLLSGTNKDYGTRCEMTNLHGWYSNEE